MLLVRGGLPERWKRDRQCLLVGLRQRIGSISSQFEGLQELKLTVCCCFPITSPSRCVCVPASVLNGEEARERLFSP